MATLRTIGYQGTVLADFIAALKAAGVRIVIDVRDAPISRKPGFAKTALAAALAEAGIAYRHLRWLGNPKAGRDAARAGDLARYRRIYGERLASPEAQAALAEAGRIAAAGGACLMCFERDPGGCHRAIVAAALGRRLGLAIDHLRV